MWLCCMDYMHACMPMSASSNFRHNQCVYNQFMKLKHYLESRLPQTNSELGMLSFCHCHTYSEPVLTFHLLTHIKAVLLLVVKYMYVAYMYICTCKSVLCI